MYAWATRSPSADIWAPQQLREGARERDVAGGTGIGPPLDPALGTGRGSAAALDGALARPGSMEMDDACDVPGEPEAGRQAEQGEMECQDVGAPRAGRLVDGLARMPAAQGQRLVQAGERPCPSVREPRHLRRARHQRMRRDADFDRWLQQQNPVLQRWVEQHDWSSRPRTWISDRASGSADALEAVALVEPALLEPTTRNNNDFLTAGQNGLMQAKTFARSAKPMTSLRTSLFSPSFFRYLPWTTKTARDSSSITTASTHLSFEQPTKDSAAVSSRSVTYARRNQRTKSSSSLNFG